MPSRGLVAARWAPLLLSALVTVGCRGPSPGGGYDLASSPRTRPAPTTAEPPARQARLDADTAVALALRWHPRRRRDAARVAEGRGLAHQVGVWANPEVEIETDDGELERAAGFGADAKVTIGVSWALPLWNRSGRRAAAADAGVRVLEQEAAITDLELELAVRTAFARALAAAQGLVQARAAVELAAHELAAEQRRRERGVGTEPQLLRAQLEREGAAIDLQAAQSREEAARVELGRTMGLPALVIEALEGALRTEWPAINAARALGAALDRAPALRAAAARVRRAGTAVEREAGAVWPEPTIRVALGTERRDGRARALIAWGLSLEIPSFDLNRGAVAAARAGVEAERARLDETRIGVVAEMRRLTLLYDRTRTRLQQSEAELLPRAARALELVRRGHPTEFTQLDLIDAQRTLNGVRARLQRQRARLATLAAAVEVLAGRSLEELSN